MFLFSNTTQTADAVIMRIHRTFDTPIGGSLLSLLIGMAIATLFQRTCEGEDCHEFRGPVLGDIQGKVFAYGDRCYQRTVKATLPDPEHKRIVPATDPHSATNSTLQRV